MNSQYAQYSQCNRAEQAHGHVSIAGDQSFLNHFSLMGNLTVSASGQMALSTTLPSHAYDHALESQAFMQRMIG